jgi:hypothetical protein
MACAAKNGWTEPRHGQRAEPYTSGSRMCRLQSNRPARHDMLNGDAVILHHNALHD